MKFTADRGLRRDRSAPVLTPVLVLLALARPAQPFSRGASGSSCARMVPGHVHAHPHDPALSHVTLHASSTRYLPGHLVTVTVRSSRDFMGFLLQARRAERPQSPGGMGAVLVGGAWTLTPPGTHTIRCVSDGDTVTHSDKQLKRNLSFVWRAPDRRAGDVRFYMTVVQSYFVYWTGIRSPVLHDGTRGRWRGSFHSMLQVQTSAEDSSHDQEDETANIATSTIQQDTERQTTGFNTSILATPSRFRTHEAPTSPLDNFTVSTARAKTGVNLMNDTKGAGIGAFIGYKALVEDKSTQTNPEDADINRLTSKFTAMNESAKDSEANMLPTANATNSSSLLDSLLNDAAFSEANGATQTPQMTTLKSRLGTTSLKNDTNLDDTSGKTVTDGFEVREISKQSERSSFSNKHKLGFGQSVSKEQSFPANFGKKVGTSKDMLESATENPQVSLHTSLDTSKAKIQTKQDKSGSTIFSLLQNLDTTQSWIETNYSTNSTPQTKQVHQEESISTNFAPFERLKDLLLHLDSLFAEDKTTFPPFVVKPTKSITTKSTSPTYSMPTSSVQGKYIENTTLIDSSDIATSSGLKMTTVSRSSTINPINTTLNDSLESKSQHDTIGELKGTLLLTSKSAQMTNSDLNSVITSTSTSPTSTTQNLSSIYTISRRFSTIWPTHFYQSATNFKTSTSRHDASSPSTLQTLFHGSKFRDKATSTVSKVSAIVPTSTAQNTASHGSAHSFKLITGRPTSNIFDSMSTHKPSTALQDTSPMQNASTIPSIEFASISMPKSSTGQSLNTVSTNYDEEATKFMMKFLAKRTNSTTYASNSSHRSITTLQETTNRPSFTSTFSPTNNYNAATISEYITPTSFLIGQNPTLHQKSTSERGIVRRTSETNSLMNDATTNEHQRSTTLSNDMTTAHSGQQFSQFSSVLALTLDQKATTVSKEAKVTFKNPILHDYSTNYPFYSRPFGHISSVEPRDTTTVPTMSNDYTSITTRDDFDLISESLPVDFSTISSSQSKASTITQSSSIANVESSRQTTSDNSLRNITNTSESAKVITGKSDFQHNTLVSEVSIQSGPLSNNSTVDLQHWPTFKVSVEASTTQSVHSSPEHVAGLEPISTSSVIMRTSANSNTASEIKLATSFQDTTPIAPISPTPYSKMHGATLEDTTFLQQSNLTTAKTIDSTGQSKVSESSTVSSPAYTSTKGYATSHSSNFNDAFATTVEDTFITSMNLASKTSKTIPGDSTVNAFSKSPLGTNSSAIVTTNFNHNTLQEGSVISSITSLHQELKQAPKGITVGPVMQHYSPTNVAKNSWQNSSLERANTSLTMAIPSTFSSYTKPDNSDTKKPKISPLLDDFSKISAATNSEQNQAFEGAIEPTTKLFLVNGNKEITHSSKNNLLDNTRASTSQSTKQSSPLTIPSPTTATPHLSTMKSYINVLTEGRTATLSTNDYGFQSYSSNTSPVSSIMTSPPLIRGSSAVDLNNTPQKSPIAPFRQSTSNYFFKTRPSSSVASKTSPPPRPSITAANPPINPTQASTTLTPELFPQRPRQSTVQSMFYPSNSQPASSTVSITRQRFSVGSNRTTYTPKNPSETLNFASSNRKPDLEGDAMVPTTQSTKPKTNLASELKNLDHKLTPISKDATFILTTTATLSHSSIKFANPKWPNGSKTATFHPTSSLLVTTSSENSKHRQINSQISSTVVASQATTKGSNSFPNLFKNRTLSLSSTLQTKTMANFPKLPTQSPISSPPNIVSPGLHFVNDRTMASPTSSPVNYRPSAARRSFINRITTSAATLAQKTPIVVALPNRDTEANSAISRISQNTDRNVKPKVEVKAKLPPYPDPDREGKYPDIIPRHSAWELGMLLGCSAGLGMVLVVGVRYVYRQACGKRTQVTLHDREQEYSRGERGLIHVQECGDLVRVRRIRENSFVLLAEYDILATPGD